MKRLLLTAILLPGLCFGASKSTREPGDKPNIIYILADDLGYGDLGSYGQKQFKTPHLDKMAKKGMRFTQHYSGSTVCAPSRCSLMTGVHTGHAAVRGNKEVEPEGQSPMPANTFTLAHMLKKAGYVTGCFGKWGLGFPGSASEPLKMGFDRFYGYNCQRLSHHYYPHFLWNDDKREILWGNFGHQANDYGPDVIQEKTLEFIEKNKDKPFFCFYTLVQPHAEMFAPEEYMKKYRGKYLPESSYEGTDDGPNYRKFAYGSQPEARAAFAAMIEVMDEDMGELVDKLKKLGIDKNTLIIFTSDNGPHQEGGHDPVFFNSSGSLRGFKRDLYEGGIRVPMIAYWPGQVKAKKTTDHLSAFWDIMPTLAELTGQAVPDNSDGVSFLPTLLGKKEQSQHEYLYWEFHDVQGRVAVRQGKWKGIRYNVAKDPDSPLELYDISADPKETTNLAGKHPDVVASLDKIIKSARVKSPEPAFNFPLVRDDPASAKAHLAKSKPGKLEGVWKMEKVVDLTAKTTTLGENDHYIFTTKHIMTVGGKEDRPIVKKNFAKMTAEEIKSQLPAGGGFMSYEIKKGKIHRTTIFALSELFEGNTIVSEYEVTKNKLILRDNHYADKHLREWHMSRVE